MVIISQKEAKEQGLKRYFTGRSCPKGHVCERFVNNWACVECQYERRRNWGKDNKARQSYQEKYYYENKQYFKEKGLKRRHEKKEEVKAYNKRYRETHPRDYNPDYYREYQRNYQKNNPVGQLRYSCRKIAERLLLKRQEKSRMSLLKYTAEEYIEHLLKGFPFGTLREAYDADYQLDHIVPVSFIAKTIKDKNLAFRVAMDLDNLQLLHRSENIKKSNNIDDKSEETIKYLWEKYNIGDKNGTVCL